MNIIILGAGQVGGSLAASLVREDNDITLIDNDEHRLHDLQQRLDIRTIVGHASHPDVLQAAGGASADMLIAVTNSDETNIVACQAAHSLFHTPTKLARIRSKSYLNYPELLEKGAIPIDVCISPEQLLTDYVVSLIDFPGALQVLDFAEGKVQLVAVKPYYGGPLVGKTLAEIHSVIPNTNMRVAAIFRRHRAVELSDDIALEVGDEVFFIATPNGIRATLKALGRLDSPYKKITIAGGGHIGLALAQALEQRYDVKIIDRNAERTKHLAETLDKATVLHGNSSDRELLINENIDYTDVFCAVTNDDEANIMSCLQAKRLGARHVMALINNTPYVDLVEGGFIDIAISPQQATIGGILTHIRRGDVANVYSLRRGAAEAIEIVAHGDKKTSKVVGRPLKDIKLPPGTTVAAVVRNQDVLIACDELVLESDDHVILFVLNKKRINEVEKLFQVSLGFFG